MPIFQSITTHQSEIIIWHITEEEQFFTEHSGLISNKIHLKKRLEYLASRYCLQLLIPEINFNNIKKDSKGKPYVADLHTDFSISHSFPYVAVAINHHQKIGIDIQTLQEKIHRLQPKFLSPYEMDLCKDKITAITFSWCCKEAMYKKYALGGLDFKANMPLTQLTVERDKAYGTIHFNFQGIAYIQHLQGSIEQDFAWSITTMQE